MTNEHEKEYRRSVVRAMIFDEQGRRVLVGKRGHGAFAGCWELFGGKVDRRHGKSESPQRAIRREIREEIGLTFYPWLLRTYIDKSMHPEDPRRILVFTGSAKGKLHLNQDEVTKVKWVQVLPDEATPADTLREQILRMRHFAFDHRGLLGNFYLDARNGLYQPAKSKK